MAVNLGRPEHGGGNAGTEQLFNSSYSGRLSRLLSASSNFWNFNSFESKRKKLISKAIGEKCRKRFFIFIDFRFTRFLYAKRPADVVAASSFYPTLLPNLRDFNKFPKSRLLNFVLLQLDCVIRKCVFAKPFHFYHHQHVSKRV